MQLHNSLQLYKNGIPHKFNHDGVKNSIKGDLMPKFQSCFLYVFLLLLLKRFVWRYNNFLKSYKVSNRNARTRGEVYSKLTIKTPERRQCLYC